MALPDDPRLKLLRELLSEDGVIFIVFTFKQNASKLVRNEKQHKTKWRKQREQKLKISFQKNFRKEQSQKSQVNSVY